MSDGELAAQKARAIEISRQFSRGSVETEVRNRSFVVYGQTNCICAINDDSWSGDDLVLEDWLSAYVRVLALSASHRSSSVSEFRITTI